MEFFTYLRFRLESTAQSEDDEAKESLAKDAARLLSLCEAYDEAAKDQAVIDRRRRALQDILQADSLDAMNSKIDELAMANQITPALILTASKAHMSVKESPYTSEEVKDVMAHLYFKMKDTTAASTTQRGSHPQIHPLLGRSTGSTQRPRRGIHSRSRARHGRRRSLMVPTRRLAQTHRPHRRQLLPERRKKTFAATPPR